MSRKEIEENLKSMSLGDHLEELRARMILSMAGLLIGMVVCLFFGKYLIAFLEKPYYDAISSHIIIADPNAITGVSAEHTLDRQLIGLQTKRPTEGFMTYIKICLVFGLLMTSPWVFWQVWLFISAGLYGHEKKFVKVVAPVSAALFITGALFFLFQIAPFAMLFFIKFNSVLSLSSYWFFEDYMNMILILTLIFGLAFQMPLALVFAERMGLIDVEKMCAGRRYVAVALVIFAAIATPPDPITQVSLAIPLYILYEGSIITCRILRKKKTHLTE